MAKGRLAPNQVLPANVDTTIYDAAGAFQYSEVSFNILNQTALDATIKVAISTTNPPTASDYIENGVVLTRGGSLLERTQLKLSVGEKLIVTSDVPGVVTRVWGEEIA